MAIEIRFARPDDGNAVAGLVAAMDLHYQGAAGDLTEIEAAAGRWVSEQNSGVRFVLACEGSKAIGLAVVAELYPGKTLSNSMYLKDLFVADEARSLGIGGALLRFLAGYCVDNGLNRIDLTTARDDAAARRFYDRLGGETLDLKISYRFGPEALRRLALNPDDIEER